jgi:hypothetical protein
VTEKDIEKLYDDKDLFHADFDVAKKEHREKRLYEIRNKGGKPYKYTKDESKISDGKFQIWHTFF